MSNNMGERFWADTFTEPKRQYRFVLANMRGIPMWIVKSVSKPSFTVSESEHSFINYKFYYPGRIEWSEVTLTLIDPVQPDATATLMEMVRDMGYVYPSDFDSSGIITISKEKSIKALGDRIYIQQIDPDGRGVVESWELNNPWIKSLNFGELSYESDDLVNIEVSIRYDWARCLLNPREGESFVTPPPGERLSSDLTQSDAIEGSGRPQS